MTKTILVVGAGDALGGAIARRFAAEGYVAAIARRSATALEGLCGTIGQEGGTALPMAFDATDEKAVTGAFETLEKSGHSPDVVVYNAGAWHRESVLETSAEIYERIWRNATFGAFLVGREAARHMAPGKRGTILFTGATASLRGSDGFAAFAGAKFALRALAQSMARELGPRGIHVGHIVIDGVINTPDVHRRFADYVATLPEQGLLEPDAIAENYWQLHCQPANAWSFEIDLRPWAERW